MSQGLIAIVGANGHTGGFVASELRRQGFTPLLIGRDANRLAALGTRLSVEQRSARIEVPAELDAAMAGASAVVNCAGPFFDTAIPVIDAALRARIPYLDVCAEQSTVQNVFRERDSHARAAGIMILPAVAFYGGLADLLATAAAGGLDEVREIRIGVALDSWHPTKGTRETGSRNTAPRLIQRNGELIEMGVPAAQAEWQFPMPFGDQSVLMLPFSEIILISRHIDVQSIESWMSLTPLSDLRNPDTPPPVAVDDQGRSAQSFVLDVHALGSERRARATIAGRDIYASTAPLIVEAVKRLLSGDVRRGPGVRALADAFDSRRFLDAIASSFERFELSNVRTS